MPTKLPRKIITLSAADQAALDRIREHYGLPSASAAIRYAVQRTAEAIPKPGKGRTANVR